jgi:thiamine biosynthesis lipoprotein
MTTQAFPTARSMPALGTTASIVVEDPALADPALAMLAADLVALDEACSRFRPDSELRRRPPDRGERPAVRRVGVGR